MPSPSNSHIGEAFRGLYYHLYANGQSSRAERIVEDMTLALLVKLAAERAGRAHVWQSVLDGADPAVLLELAQLSYDDHQFVPARGYYGQFLATSRGQQDARSLLLGARLAKVFQDRDKAAEYGLQLRRLYPGTPEYQQFLAEQK